VCNDRERRKDIDKFHRRLDPGEPPTTDPDWVPIMKRAAASSLTMAGATSQRAIVSRELALLCHCPAPATATHILHETSRKVNDSPVPVARKGAVL